MKHKKKEEVLKQQAERTYIWKKTQVEKFCTEHNIDFGKLNNTQKLLLHAFLSL
jgi:hypothetical protein